ncbi:MAG: AMP-binding protein, partial [Rhodobacteraceae bacterium]|nr:AMP-binding protein [Paracoccaceae bacterium]
MTIRKVDIPADVALDAVKIGNLSIAMTLAHWLERTARAHPELPALALGHSTVRRYDALANVAARLAGWLVEAGVGPGDRVAVISENRPELFETLLATWWRGAIAAPLTPSLVGDGLAARLTDIAPKACLVSPRAAAAVAAAMPACGARLAIFEGPEHRRALMSDPVPIASAPRSSAALLRYAGCDATSPGTLFSHHALMNISLSYLAEVDAATPRDAVLHGAPASEGGLFLALVALARGGVNVSPESGGFDAAELFDLAAGWRRATALADTNGLKDLVRSDADCDPTAFRTLLLDGDSTAPDEKTAALDRFGPRLAQAWGPPAMPFALCRLGKHDIAARGEAFWREKLSSVGRCFLMSRAEVRRTDGGEVAPDEIGELVAQAPHAAASYWNAPAATATMTTDDGWVRTGRWASMDARGYVALSDSSAEPLSPETASSAESRSKRSGELPRVRLRPPKNRPKRTRP